MKRNDWIAIAMFIVLAVGAGVSSDVIVSRILGVMGWIFAGVFLFLACSYREMTNRAMTFLDKI